MAPDGHDDALLAQLRRGVLQHCVLALLAQERRYAYEVVRALGAVEGMVTTEGTIYPLLSRLRRAGLVSTSWKESTSGPPRRYYETTAAGRAELARFAAEWRTFARGVDQLITEGAQR
jgi:PadR family transcriptional regulator PadR